jgi:hypothetical protein
VYTIVAIGLVIVAVIAFKNYLTKKRRETLLAKYHDGIVVERIMNGTIWQGMSQEQLIDSWGSPVAKDQKIYKTKTAETFKYNQTGKNRFGSRVHVENGIVVGWDKK